MFGYFITRKLELAIVTLSSSKCLDISSQKKLGLATATSSSAKCLDISSQENWDLPLPHQVQQNVWIFHHKKTGTCHCHIKFSKMFGYFITRKLGLATATLSSAKCLDISSQENWDLPLPHQVQQNVWIFHHKKTGTCHCHIKFSKIVWIFHHKKTGTCHCHIKFIKMFGYFITRKLGLAIATLSSAKMFGYFITRKLGLAVATLLDITD
ncbi:Hypothetical predicted protein [Mytilus galloprovincialis]|uniref:Uncharacterized protein n=1 Tax=Mytilus galloprovincialis TaxID=29158 RepID=A0A8B6GS28_MYTGA|nr:Hypothetical predicted protein [Mytilus galloprovincialis]